MERGSRILVFLALFAGLYFFFGNRESAMTKKAIQTPTVIAPLQTQGTTAPPAAHCDLWTDEYRARISTHGAVLVGFQPLTAKYKKGKEPLQLVTTPDHPELGPLLASFRSAADTADKVDWLVKSHYQYFKITKTDKQSCSLVSDDGRARIEKTFTTGESPYSLNIDLKITNLTDQAHPYAFSMGISSYLLDRDVASQMLRLNPRMTHVECVPLDDEGKVVRELSDAFEPDELDDPERFFKNSINPGTWSQPPGEASIAAISNAYFTTSVAHDAGPLNPSCLLQIDHRWRGASRDADPLTGAIYQARLAYDRQDLKAGESATFKHRSFIGPKERKALAAAGDRFDPIIDLGFFSVIAKVLVSYLLWLYHLIPSWGVAIVLLTVTARTLLFPLTWPSVKNMVHMRELKPEMDKLNEKYKDDPQAKGLAQMELWKKHGVNPMKGCLPQLISMPVWFALYTTLQTAVELYNIPFLWFPDLSEPDPFYALPFVIGLVFFVQQKLMPMQADPAQQKMMLYFMPGMFTVFMLFLPAGLGVYMFTNSLLGIAQQQLVEIHAKKTLSERRAKAEISQTPGAEKKKNKRS